MGSIAPRYYIQVLRVRIKKRKDLWFTVLRLIDISDFRDTKIVDILSGTVDSNLKVNLKIPHRSGVTRSNTNTAETITSFNKFKRPENDKIDSKVK